MDYIEKLFNQYPFVYVVDNCYYGFGNQVCLRFDTMNQSKAKFYKMEFDEAVKIKNADQIRQYFKVIKSFVSSYAAIVKYNGTPCTTFEQFQFSSEQRKQIENQVKQYIDIYQEYIK